MVLVRLTDGQTDPNTEICGRIGKLTTATKALFVQLLSLRHTSVHPVTEKNVTACVSIEDGKIIGKGFAGEDSEDVTEWTSRELLEDGTMLQCIYFGDIVCKRWFVKEA